MGAAPAATPRRSAPAPAGSIDAGDNGAGGGSATGAGGSNAGAGGTPPAEGRADPLWPTPAAARAAAAPSRNRRHVRGTGGAPQQRRRWRPGTGGAGRWAAWARRRRLGCMASADVASAAWVSVARRRWHGRRRYGHRRHGRRRHGHRRQPGAGQRLRRRHARGVHQYHHVPVDRWLFRRLVDRGRGHSRVQHSPVRARRRQRRRPPERHRMHHRGSVRRRVACLPRRHELDALNITCAQARLPPVGGVAAPCALLRDPAARRAGLDLQRRRRHGHQRRPRLRQLRPARDADCAPLSPAVAHRVRPGPALVGGDNNTGITEGLL